MDWWYCDDFIVVEKVMLVWMEVLIEFDFKGDLFELCEIFCCYFIEEQISVMMMFVVMINLWNCIQIFMY